MLGLFCISNEEEGEFYGANMCVSVRVCEFERTKG